MPTLDPRPALVVIDLQIGILGHDTAPFTADDVVARSGALAAAFRAADLPVVLVNVDATAPGRTSRNPEGVSMTLPPEAIELAPELDARPTDKRVTKHTWGAFVGTDLAEHLEQEKVTQIVLTGVSTSIGVETTARTAYELGLNVLLATDAMTDTDEASHDHSVRTIFPRLGETATTEEVLALLAATAE